MVLSKLFAFKSAQSSQYSSSSSTHRGLDGYYSRQRQQYSDNYHGADDNDTIGDDSIDSAGSSSTTRSILRRNAVKNTERNVSWSNTFDTYEEGGVPPAAAGYHGYGGDCHGDGDDSLFQQADTSETLETYDDPRHEHLRDTGAEESRQDAFDGRRSGDNPSHRRDDYGYDDRKMYEYASSLSPEASEATTRTYSTYSTLDTYGDDDDDETTLHEATSLGGTIGSVSISVSVSEDVDESVEMECVRLPRRRRGRRSRKTSSSPREPTATPSNTQSPRTKTPSSSSSPPATQEGNRFLQADPSASSELMAGITDEQTSVVGSRHPLPPPPPPVEKAAASTQAERKHPPLAPVEERALPHSRKDFRNLACVSAVSETTLEMMKDRYVGVGGEDEDDKEDVVTKGDEEENDMRVGNNAKEVEEKAAQEKEAHRGKGASKVTPPPATHPPAAAVAPVEKEEKKKKKKKEKSSGNMKTNKKKAAQEASSHSDSASNVTAPIPPRNSGKKEAKKNISSNGKKEEKKAAQEESSRGGSAPNMARPRLHRNPGKKEAKKKIVVNGKKEENNASQEAPSHSKMDPPPPSPAPPATQAKKEAKKIPHTAHILISRKKTEPKKQEESALKSRTAVTAIEPARKGQNVATEQHPKVAIDLSAIFLPHLTKEVPTSVSHTDSDTHGSLMSIDELSFDDENEGQGTLTTLGKDGPAGDGGGESSTIDESGTATVEDSETALEESTLDETSRGADAGEGGTPPDGDDVHAASDDSSFASFEREPRGWDEAHMRAASDNESVASFTRRHDLGGLFERQRAADRSSAGAVGLILPQFLNGVVGKMNWPLGKDGLAGDGGGESSTIDKNGTATVEDGETALEGSTLDETSRGADAGEGGTPPDGDDVHAASDDSSFASFEREPRGWDDESVASFTRRHDLGGLFERQRAADRSSAGAVGLILPQFLNGVVGKMKWPTMGMTMFESWDAEALRDDLVNSASSPGTVTLSSRDVSVASAIEVSVNEKGEKEEKGKEGEKKDEDGNNKAVSTTAAMPNDGEKIHADVESQSFDDGKGANKEEGHGIPSNDASMSQLSAATESFGCSFSIDGELAAMTEPTTSEKRCSADGEVTVEASGKNKRSIGELDIVNIAPTISGSYDDKVKDANYNEGKESASDGEGSPSDDSTEVKSAQLPSDEGNNDVRKIPVGQVIEFEELGTPNMPSKLKKKLKKKKKEKKDNNNMMHQQDEERMILEKMLPEIVIMDPSKVESEDVYLNDNHEVRHSQGKNARVKQQRSGLWGWKKKATGTKHSNEDIVGAFSQMQDIFHPTPLPPGSLYEHIDNAPDEDVSSQASSCITTESILSELRVIENTAKMMYQQMVLGPETGLGGAPNACHNDISALFLDGPEGLEETELVLEVPREDLMVMRGENGHCDRRQPSETNREGKEGGACGQQRQQQWDNEEEDLTKKKKRKKGLARWFSRFFSSRKRKGASSRRLHFGPLFGYSASATWTPKDETKTQN